MTIKPVFVFTSLLASACVSPPEQAPDDPSGARETASVQEINGNDSPASQYMLDRAVAIPGCTATRISRTFAITAMHCSPDVGDTVYFYSTGPGRDAGVVARIAEVLYRPGASPGDCCDDNTGTFADVALLRLTNHPQRTDVPEGEVATLAWSYPGEDAWGKKVGAGQHDGNDNPTRILLQVSDTTDSPTDSGGYFTTTDDNTQGGDSGGPFYMNGRILGTLKGSGWDPWDGEWNKYTSVPAHLNWILTKIGYRWIGTPPQLGSYYHGSTIESFFGAERECQYACEHTASCDAYNYFPPVNSCELVGSVTHATANASYSSALHYGQSAGNSNEVVGYVRSDGFNAVVHEASDGQVHELYLDGTWKAASLSNFNPPAVGSKLSAYVRADGKNAVVYRSTTNRIIELALGSTGWTWYDLSAYGGVAPVGNPVAYVRADGVSAVVYRGTDSKIHELRLGTSSWLPTNLTEQAGSTVLASSDPSAFVRSDGYSSVVFRAGTTVFELYKAGKGGWVIGAPSSLSPGAPAAAGRPFGYTHADGINAIVYRSTSARIVELWVDSTGWHHAELPNAINASGNPVAYVRADSLEAVVYRSTGNQIVEAVNAPWNAWNLSTIAGAWNTTTDPAVFLRKDGYHSVVFEGAGGHVGEIYWRLRGPNWAFGNLTLLSGETP